MAMTDEAFELWVRQLQQQSFVDAREVFGEKGFERWLNPRFNQPMPDADCSACVKGTCGDTMEIFLKFQNDRVEKASYKTDGCGSSALCGSFTAELAHGKSPEDLLELEAHDLLRAIGTFPEKDKHCATLSILVLHEAVNNYMIKQVSGIKR